MQFHVHCAAENILGMFLGPSTRKLGFLDVLASPENRSRFEAGRNWRGGVIYLSICLFVLNRSALANPRAPAKPEAAQAMRGQRNLAFATEYFPCLLLQSAKQLESKCELAMVRIRPNPRIKIHMIYRSARNCMRMRH